MAECCPACGGPMANDVCLVRCEETAAQRDRVAAQCALEPGSPELQETLEWVERRLETGGYAAW